MDIHTYSRLYVYLYQRILIWLETSLFLHAGVRVMRKSLCRPRVSMTRARCPLARRNGARRNRTAPERRKNIFNPGTRNAFATTIPASAVARDRRDVDDETRLAEDDLHAFAHRHTGNRCDRIARRDRRRDRRSNQRTPRARTRRTRARRCRRDRRARSAPPARSTGTSDRIAGSSAGTSTSRDACDR